MIYIHHDMVNKVNTVYYFRIDNRFKYSCPWTYPKCKENHDLELEDFRHNLKRVMRCELINQLSIRNIHKSNTRSKNIHASSLNNI